MTTICWHSLICMDGFAFENTCMVINDDTLDDAGTHDGDDDDDDDRGDDGGNDEDGGDKQRHS